MKRKTINIPPNKKVIPFHPLAFALYPILALSAANLNYLSLREANRALLVVGIAAILLWCIFRLVTRNWGTAGGMTTLVSVLFFSYGHIHSLASRETDATLWLSILWGIILIWGSQWILSHSAQMISITKTMNVVGTIILFFPLYTTGVHYLSPPSQPLEVNHDVPTLTDPSILPNQNSNEFPDIYYIILDGYGRGDVLAEIYDFDNQPLLDYLEELGFYVAEESHTNYNQTFLSIPTSLNMAYIEDLLDVEPTSTYNHKQHVNLIQNNQAYDFLSQAGYKFVSFSSGHSLTEIRKADYYMHPEDVSDSPSAPAINLFGQLIFPTPFEILLAETTALRPILPGVFQTVTEPEKYQARRQRITYAFSHLADFAQAEGSYFIFAHIIAPHPPFVFQANGEPRVNMQPYSIADGTHFVGNKGSRAEYITGYRNQIGYINLLLLETIENILTQSEIPPVIILQADHGPGAYFDWHSLEKTNQTERMGILNAYYFPGGDEGWLYPSITPINTFRVVFNRYFDLDLELLEDKSFFSDWSTPFDFIDITEMLHE